VHLSGAGALCALAAGLAGCSAGSEWPAFQPVPIERGDRPRRILVLPSAYESFLRGQVAFAEEDHDGAARHFRAALRTDPESPYLHTWVARAELSRGRLAEARRQVDSALEEDPCSEFALCTAGRILEGERDEQGAMRSFRRAIECEPRQPEAYLLLGDFLERIGAPGRAEEVYRALLEVASRPAQAHERLSRLALERGDTEVAARHLSALLAEEPWRSDAVARLARLSLDAGNTVEARSLLTALVGRAPRAPEPRQLLVEVLLAAGDTAGAARHLDQLRTGDEDAAPLAEAATLYIRARRYEQAEAEARQALELDPSHPGALLALGAALRRQGQVAPAVAALRRIGPGEDLADRARAEAGLALAEAGRADEAVVALRRRLSEEPASPMSRELLSRLIAGQGDQQGAEDLLRAGETVADAVALGRFLLDRGRHREAAEAVEDAATGEVRAPAALIVLAEARLGLGDEAGAEAPARRAAELAPRDARALAALGAVESARARHDVALGLLERARCLEPGVPWILWRAAEALGRAGRCVYAAAAARSASRLAPPPAFAGPLARLASSEGCVPAP